MLKFQEYLDKYLTEQNGIVSNDWILNATEQDLENYLRSHQSGKDTKEKITAALIKIRDAQQKSGKSIKDLSASKANAILMPNPANINNTNIIDSKGKKPKHFLHLEK